jgi:hypothetical protein
LNGRCGPLFRCFFVGVVALLPARLGKKLPIRIALPAPYVASTDVGTEALLRFILKHVGERRKRWWTEETNQDKDRKARALRAPGWILLLMMWGGGGGPFSSSELMVDEGLTPPLSGLGSLWLDVGVGEPDNQWRCGSYWSYRGLGAARRRQALGSCTSRRHSSRTKSTSEGAKQEEVAGKGKSRGDWE